MERRGGWVSLRVKLASSDRGWREAKRIAAWGESGWRLAYVSGLPYHFPSKRKGKFRAATVRDVRRVASFICCWAGLAWTAGAGGGGASGSECATWVARSKERGATREDKSLRDASRLDVAGGEGVAERSAWAEVRVSACEVKKVTEAPRVLTMAMRRARRGAIAS